MVGDVKMRTGKMKNGDDDHMSSLMHGVDNNQ